jgi:hypothetical protein
VRKQREPKKWLEHSQFSNSRFGQEILFYTFLDAIGRDEPEAPPPPAEKATTRQDQAREASASDGAGNWCGGIGSDDARKVARGRIVVMEESRHKKSLENRRKIKEAQCPGARAWYRREREPGSDDGDGDDHYDGRDQTFEHYFSFLVIADVMEVHVPFP